MKKLIYILTLALTVVIFTKCDEFKIIPITKVETGEASSLATSITVEGEIIDLSGKGNDDYGFCYATHRNDPSIDDNKISKGKPQIGNFTSNIEGLSLNTLYYIRAYCQSAEGIVYGTTITVTTLDGTKTLTTTTPTDITATSVQCGGTITSDGGADITARGVVYDTSPNPTIENNIGKTVNGTGTGTGSFTVNIKGLNINTTYYVRAYATNNVGTQYGDQVSFRTGYRLNDYVGEYSIQCKIGNDVNLRTYSPVVISSIEKDEDGIDIYIEGLYQGKSWYIAYGKWENNEKCIILQGGYYDEAKSFYFTSEPGINYYGIFRPIFRNENSDTFYWLFGGDNDWGEAKLVMNNDCTISYQGSIPDENNRTANGFVYRYYLVETDEYKGYLSSCWDITLVPLNSPSGIKAYNTKQKVKSNEIKKISNAVNSIDLPIKQTDSPINNTK